MIPNMPDDTFEADVRHNIRSLAARQDLRDLSLNWIREVSRHKYSYNFTWLGRPIMQFPQDIIAVQELIWRIRPDLIIETGIAHGGSLILSASIQALAQIDGEVVGIDIDIRAHNRLAIEQHPLSNRIRLIEGPSVEPRVFDSVRDVARRHTTVMVLLDSNHTHDHVSKELQLYSPLVTRGSYLIVFDTIIEFLPVDFFSNRPWSVGNNPNTAVSYFLQSTDRFEADTDIEAKLLITTARGGYLKCVK